jgi:hypothetical protein
MPAPSIFVDNWNAFSKLLSAYEYNLVLLIQVRRYERASMNVRTNKLMKMRRAPGAGRKAQGRFRGKDATLTVWMDNWLWAQLDNGAEKNKRTLDQEIEQRLKQELRRDRIPPKLATLAKNIEEIERGTGKNWEDDCVTAAALCNNIEFWIPKPDGTLPLSPKDNEAAAEVGNTEAAALISSIEATPDADLLKAAAKIPNTLPPADEWHYYRDILEDIGTDRDGQHRYWETLKGIRKNPDDWRRTEGASESRKLRARQPRQGVRVQQKSRISQRTRAQLENAHTWSQKLTLSQYAALRLKRSLEHPQYRPAVTALIEMIAILAERVERNTGKKWEHDAFIAAALRHGIKRLVIDPGPDQRTRQSRSAARRP